jgi:hypothetical protein
VALFSAPTLISMEKPAFAQGLSSKAILLRLTLERRILPLRQSMEKPWIVACT